MIDGWNQQLQTKLAEVNSLSASLNEILVKNQRANDSVKYALTSIDLDRVKQDNEIFDAAMQTLFNWTKENYGDVWSEMDIRYKLDDSIGRVVFENARNWAYQYNPNPNDEIWSKYISSRSKKLMYLLQA